MVEITIRLRRLHRALYELWTNALHEVRRFHSVLSLQWEFLEL